MNREHVHLPLDEEVTAIGGSYRLVKEERIDIDGREVLYIVGHGVFDTTCCGAGGCAYALVPGYVIEWKTKTNADGLQISNVAPIEDDLIQKKLIRLIKSQETVQEIHFV